MNIEILEKNVEIENRDKKVLIRNEDGTVNRITSLSELNQMDTMAQKQIENIQNNIKARAELREKIQIELKIEKIN